MSTGSVVTTILTGGAAQAAGTLVGPATDAGKGIFYCLKRKYEFIKNLSKNFENLDKEARYLSSREKDVRDSIEKNQATMEKSHECITWLEDVEKMTASLNNLKTKYQKLCNASCGSCQLRTRLKLSRQIVKMTKSIVDLKDRFKELILLTERRPDKVEKKYPKKSVNDVPSLREHVEKLLEYLQDDSLRKIGIWGMFGVGKTTILENLNDEVEKLQIFDIVLMLTVSKEGGLLQIQQTVLKRLNVKVEGIDTVNQAATLISRLLESKKYLLLLDEVSSEIDLRLIGIHESHSQGKVVVATRDRTICDSIGVDEEIKVERLSRDDARKLFHDAVGEAVEHPRIKPIAERVLKQCGELPQVIRAVGIHLKGKLNEDFWWNTLSKLRSPIMRPLENFADLFNAFRVIYEELDDTLKDCLLYGASFPEDYEIYRDYLIECWKAEELIGSGQTLRRTREEGHSNLDSFIEKCLFDECISTKYVKMPIIFRNLARMHDFGLLLREGEEFENQPPVEKWTDAKVISMMNSNLDELPDRPNCSKISTLFLQKNRVLSMIPASFFDCMHTLKMLDLCGTGIKSLPPSVSSLQNLRGLYLNDCHKLLDLPQEIEQLQSLEVLDICRTGIIGIPYVIRELTCLRCLRLSFTGIEGNQNHIEANGTDVIPPNIISTSIEGNQNHIVANKTDVILLNSIHTSAEGNENHIDANGVDVNPPNIINTSVGNNQNHFEANGTDVIPPNIIQRLVRLEELTIDACTEEAGWNKIAPTIVAEVANLGRLSNLSFYFPSTESLEIFTGTSISWRNETSQTGNNFRSFNLYVGSHRTIKSPAFDVSKCLGRRYLQYASGRDIPNGIKEILRRACAFELIGHQNIRNLSDFGIDNMECLEICLVKQCITMTNVIESGMPETPTFSWLQELHLQQLQLLNGICQGPIVAGSFARLRTLTLCDCPNVIKVVSVEMAKQLLELQYLRVANCVQVTEIIEVDTQTNGTGLFSKLKTLELVMLEALVSIHSGGLFAWHNLQRLEIIGCDKLVNLCLDTSNSMRLRRILCSEVWWGALLLNEEVKSHLQSFCRFS